MIGTKKKKKENSLLVHPQCVIKASLKGTLAKGFSTSCLDVNKKNNAQYLKSSSKSLLISIQESFVHWLAGTVFGSADCEENLLQVRSNFLLRTKTAWWPLIITMVVMWTSILNHDDQAQIMMICNYLVENDGIDNKDG